MAAGEAMPDRQAWVVGYKKRGSSITALVDDGDIHCLMIGAAGVGKTANFLYPNIEYACASGMSWLCIDTKGDLPKTVMVTKAPCLTCVTPPVQTEQKPATMGRMRFSMTLPKGCWLL